MKNLPTSQNGKSRNAKCFPPLINDDSEILILGTMPSELSLCSGEYYANPRNSFWKIIAALYNDNRPFASFEEKKECLCKARIALWDVFQTCERKGSLDSDIKKPTQNDIEALLREYPLIKKIIFNGAKAAKRFTAAVPCIKAPSTSSTYNTIPLDKKIEMWREYLETPSCKDL